MEIGGAEIAHCGTTMDDAVNYSVLTVRVSRESYQRALRLNKFLTLSASGNHWGKDQRLLRYNPLLLPDSINYTVLLAMGRTHQQVLKYSLS